MRRDRLLTVLGLAFGLPLLTLLVVAFPLGAWTESGVIHVDAVAPGVTQNGESWETAFLSLSDALITADPGDEIWVAAGFYTPTLPGDLTSTFQLQAGVAIYGGFAATETLRTQRDWASNETILSGDLGGDDTVYLVGSNAYHVVSASDITETAVLDGFTISGGAAIDSSTPHNRGGGLLIENANPTLSNLVIRGNWCSTTGAGIFATNSHSRLTAVSIVDNESANVGGGIYGLHSDLILVGATLMDNTAWSGGGIYNNEGSPTLVNCRFLGNQATGGSGGGIYNLDQSDPTFVNVLFSGNSAGQYGGAMANNSGCDPHLVNVTLSGNSAGNSGDSISSVGSSFPSASNSVLWGNTPDQIYNDLTSAISLSYCDVAGGYDSCLDLDPLFIDADGADDILGTADDDLRLAADSPLIDAGYNGALPADSVDLDGDGDTAEIISIDLAGAPRVLDVAAAADTGPGPVPIVDLGAYEGAFVDLQVHKTGTPAVVGLDAQITYTLVYSNGGSLSSSDSVLISDHLPVEIDILGISQTGVLVTLTQNSPLLIWETGELMPGFGGVITLTGEVTAPLQPAFSLTNWVTITMAGDYTPEDNVSFVTSTVSRHGIFLPAVLRDE